MPSKVILDWLSSSCSMHRCLLAPASGRHASLIIEMTTSHAPYNTYKFFLQLKHQRLSKVNSPDDVLAAAERFLLSLYCFVGQLWQLLLSRLTTLIDTCDESDGVRSFRNLVYQK
jgi:hypothetical protein